MKEQILFEVIRTTENLFPRRISEKKHFSKVGSSRGIGEEKDGSLSTGRLWCVEFK